MKKGKCIYRGKAKSLFESDNMSALVMEFRDDATAFNGKKHEVIPGKGYLNNVINAKILDRLREEKIQTHLLERISDTESMVLPLSMIPLECVYRNFAAGSLSRRLDVSEGIKLSPPILEFYFKNDALGDPLVTESHIESFGWATSKELKLMKSLTERVNNVLKPWFASVGMLLVDFKLEFGRYQGEIYLGDEFTPDGCRLWDSITLEKLDKDAFRLDLRDLVEAYTIVAKRLGIAIENLERYRSGHNGADSKSDGG